MAQLTQRFNQADKDHDGKLTRDEAKAGMPRIAEHFDDIDSEHRGYITLEQIQSAIRSRMGS
jgi:Ca2+-binding EF-hand superfamily protein